MGGTYHNSKANSSVIEFIGKKLSCHYTLLVKNGS